VSEKWSELRVSYLDEFKSKVIQGWRILYGFKRDVLLAILERHKIRDFLLLDEPECVLLRINVQQEKILDIKSEIQNSVQQSQYSSYIKEAVDVVDWSPEGDARDRILSARKRAEQIGISFSGIPEGDWKIDGSKGIIFAKDLDRLTVAENWSAARDDIERKTKEFAGFMTKVVGQFTRPTSKKFQRELMTVGCFRCLFTFFLIQFQSGNTLRRNLGFSHLFKHQALSVQTGRLSHSVIS